MATMPMFMFMFMGMGTGMGCRAETPEPTPVGSEVANPNDPDKRKLECVAELTTEADPQLHTLLRSACTEWVTSDTPGLAIAVAEPGRPTFHAELGVRCFGDPAVVEATTSFRIGSITKVVTAALALRLVEDGVLLLASDASTVPGFVAQAGAEAPKLEALLTHRSGLGEIQPSVLVANEGAWLPAIAQSPAAGPAGEYQYSNTGYSLIGAMLEQASGRSYAELLATRITTPLKLARLTTNVEVPGSACGHLVGDPDRHPIAIAKDLEWMPGDPSWMVPAGGVLSSASDLATLALALGQDRLPGTAALLEPGLALPPDQARRRDRDERYGVGLRSWTLIDGTRVFGHSGNNAAFAAELLFVPGRRAVVILSNSGAVLPATLAAAEALLADP